MPAVFDDPQVAARGMVSSFPLHDETVFAVGNAIKVVGATERPATAPPVLGADTEAILRSMGYDDARIAGLDADGVFGGTLIAGPQPVGREQA
jgi:crotonobetainyl-CoA:carnitine CoA-transferase CaiB-like acyl-CoA transferase